MPRAVREWKSNLMQIKEMPDGTLIIAWRAPDQGEHVVLVDVGIPQTSFDDSWEHLALRPEGEAA